MAKHTPGFSGADIANVCNEAALTAARRNKPEIEKQDFLDAVDRIVGGLGVIENDFHDRKDLAPNICAVYTEEAYRRRGIAGRLLDMAVEDLRAKGVSPVYLLTDHVGFYERYGWTFLCLAQGDGDPAPSRMYVHA